MDGGFKDRVFWVLKRWLGKVIGRICFIFFITLGVFFEY